MDGFPIQCSHCEVELKEQRDRVATFCVEGQGDEYIDRYWVCGECGWFLRRSFRDAFMGEEEVEYNQSTLEPEAGQAILDLIKKCPNPVDKNCDCEVHEHFRWGY